MPNQNFNLNIKAHDQGWEGKQVQLYNCAECGTDSSGAQQHSGWHDGINNALNQLFQQVQQAQQTAQQAQQTAQQALSAAQQAQATANQALARP